MNRIIAIKKLSVHIIKIDIKSPDIVAACKPGLHVMIRTDRFSDSFPVAISGVNQQTDIMILYVHLTGMLQKKLSEMHPGDEIYEIDGPFGNPVEVKKYGTVVCAAGGLGIVPIFPVANALKQFGNRVIVILGARSAEYILLEEEIRRIADVVYIVTDDGSAGNEGIVPDVMKDVFYREKIDMVVLSGPIKMIKYSTALTHMFSLPVIATLYSTGNIGSGQMGIYQVSVCAHSKYICVDGTEFNAIYPDFDTMIKRMELRVTDHYVGNQSYQKQLVLQS